MRLELRAAGRTTIDGMACRSARLNSVVFAVEFEDVRSFAGMQFHPHNPLLAEMVTQIFYRSNCGFDGPNQHAGALDCARHKQIQTRMLGQAPPPDLAQVCTAANDCKLFTAPYPLAEDSDFSSGSIIYHGPVKPCQHKIT